jgi:hypothetical protein
MRVMPTLRPTSPIVIFLTSLEAPAAIGRPYCQSSTQSPGIPVLRRIREPEQKK